MKWLLRSFLFLACDFEPCTIRTAVQNSHSSDAVCRSLLTARRSASRTPSTPLKVLGRDPGEVLDIIYQGELATWPPASAAQPAPFSAHFLHAFCTAALGCASGEWSWSDQLADLSTVVALRSQAAAAVPGTPVPRQACLDVQKSVLTWPCTSVLSYAHRWASPRTQGWRRRYAWRSTLPARRLSLRHGMPAASPDERSPMSARRSARPRAHAAHHRERWRCSSRSTTPPWDEGVALHRRCWRHR